MSSSYQLENVLFHYLQVFFILHFKILKKKKQWKVLTNVGTDQEKSGERGRGGSQTFVFLGWQKKM